MRPLSEYINPMVDGHIHLFDSSGDIFQYYTPITKTLVGFEHIDFNHLDEYTGGQIVDHYEKFLNNTTKIDYNILLLATGLSFEEIKEIYKMGGDKIKGFGEIVCYDNYDDKYLGFKNIDLIEQICQYDNMLEHPLPIYIHYSLNDIYDRNTIDGLLTKYPDIPIELCHCGAPNKHEYPTRDLEQAVNYFIELQQKHPNLWTDISDGAGVYFKENPDNVYLLDIYRTLISTDITPSHFRENRPYEQALDRIKKLTKIIPNKQNIDRLFQL